MRPIICDKCGRDDLAPLRPERHEVKIHMPGQVKSIDLCERCLARFKAWISQPDPVEA